MQDESDLESPIKQIRERCGMSQREFAKIAGIRSASVVSDIEKGLRPISEKMMTALKKAHFDVGSIAQNQTAFMRQREAELEHRLEEASEEVT